MAIYVLNFVPIVIFSLLFPRDQAYRGEPPGSRRAMGLFGMSDPRFELVAGAIMLGIGGEFLWIILSRGASTGGTFVAIPVLFGVLSVVRGWRRLLAARPSST